jgi:hypothetical protein
MPRVCRHCRRYFVPPPQVLHERLLSVYRFFSVLEDPVHERPFFTSDHERRMRVELAYVRKGYLSDPPDVPMYMPLRTLKTGLVEYRCLRTTSALEGYHTHLRQVASYPARVGYTCMHFTWCMSHSA